MKKDDCVRRNQGLLVQEGMQAHEDQEVQGGVNNNENIHGYQQQQFLQPSTTNILPDMITSFPNPLPFQMSNYNNPSSSFSFGLQENHGYQQQHFRQPSRSSSILPDMITSSPNPLPFQMSNYNNPSLSFGFGFRQRDLGMNPSFLSEFDPYKFETNITQPVRIVNIPDELSVALKGFLNPIRGADMEASSSIPDHAKGSDQLEAPSSTAPTQHISMENQGNLQDSSPQLSRKRDYNRNMVNNDPSTQLTGSAHPRPMKRTRLME